MLSSYFLELIQSASYLGLFLIIFAESGLLIGFFLPGDSLLFTAGFLASNGLLHLPLLVGVCFSAAIAGDFVGYTCGKRFGQKLFCKENSLFFHKNNLVKTHLFYEKQGGKTIILARFIPIIRTFAPIVAGIGNMHYKKFLIYNIIGALLWAVGLPVASYFLGKMIPNIDTYLLPIVLSIIFLSVLPGLLHLLKSQESRKTLLTFLRFKKHRKLNE